MQDHKDRRDHGVTMARLVLQAQQEHLVHPVSPERLVAKEISVHQAHQDLLAILERTVKSVRSCSADLLCLAGRYDSPDVIDTPQVHLDPLESPAHQDKSVYPAPVVKMAREEDVEELERTEFKESPVHRDLG